MPNESSFHQDEIVSAERTLKRLHARQNPEPSTEFIARLDRTLGAPTRPTSVVPSSRRIAGNDFRTPLLPERDRFSRRSLWAAGATALVVILVVTSLMATSIGRKANTPGITAPMAASNMGPLPTPGTGGIRWTLASLPDSTVGPNSVALGGDFLYRTTASSVQAILKETGAPIWETKGIVPWAIAADGDGVFISSSDPDGNPVLIGLDTRSGEQIWSAPLPSVSENIITHAGLVIAQDWTSHITAVDAKSGELRWQQSIGPDIAQSEKAVPAMVATDDAVIISSANRVLFALDMQNGTTFWQHEDVRANVLALSENILGIIQRNAPDYGKTLVAYDVATGFPLWQRTLDAPGDSQSDFTLLGGSDGFAFISSELGELETTAGVVVATPMSGVESWMTGASTSIFPTPIPFPVVLRVRAESGYLLSVSRWTENTGPQSEPDITSLNAAAISIAMGENSAQGIFVLCQNGRVGWFGGYGATGESFYGISTKKFNGGAVRFPHEIPGLFFNVALADDSGAYVVTTDGTLIAIDASPYSTGDGPFG
ncbi:hypothetical protein BH09CHL1_BH09CHL1_12060 [soil metagenome]